MQAVLKKLFIVFVVAISIGFSMPCLALSFGEGITQDANGDYIISYISPEDQQLKQVIYVPANKINPLLKSSMMLNHDGKIIYQYTITSQIDSRQPLAGLLIDPVSSIVLIEGKANYMALSQPQNWFGTVDVSNVGGYRIGWLLLNGGIAPGQRQAGLGFTSTDLPGLQVAQLDGYGHEPAFTDAPEGEILAQYDKLVSDTSFVPRNAAAPTIPVPTPFDPAVVLERIQTHTHTWIGMQLFDAAFSAQLDRYFQSAISAYRLNQPKVGKKHIQTMRELIKKEQPDADKEDDKDDDRNANKRFLIDKLAARILDFDLKYVMKRMGGDKGE